jgi:hypothetical protein
MSRGQKSKAKAIHRSERLRAEGLRAVAARNHVVSVAEDGAAPNAHRAVCTCGWRGELATMTLAAAAAHEHARSMA